MSGFDIYLQNMLEKRNMLFYLEEIKTTRNKL